MFVTIIQSHHTSHRLETLMLLNIYISLLYYVIAIESFIWINKHKILLLFRIRGN